jgi:hypothetical protein
MRPTTIIDCAIFLAARTLAGCGGTEDRQATNIDANAADSSCRDTTEDDTQANIDASATDSEPGGEPADSVDASATDSPCKGLAGVYEIAATEGVASGGRPWLMLTEVESWCMARVGEPWRDTVPAILSWAPDTLGVRPLEALVGGGEPDSCELGWTWTSFSLDLDSHGHLSGNGTALDSYHDKGFEGIAGMGSEKVPVTVQNPASPTELRFAFPNGRPGLLPWERSAVLEASRPTSGLANAIPTTDPFAVVWGTGERTATVGFVMDWDASRGQTYHATSIAGAVDDAGRALSEATLELPVLDVGPAATRIDFEGDPPARWPVWVSASAATPACPPGGGVMVWGEQAGLAWQLDTTGATEAWVTFADPDDSIEVAATTPDGQSAEWIGITRDATAHTVTLRFAVSAARRLGFELTVNKSVCPMFGAPSVCVLSSGTEAPAEP